MMRGHVRLVMRDGHLTRVHYTYKDDSARAATPPASLASRAQLAIPFPVTNPVSADSQPARATQTFARDASGPIRGIPCKSKTYLES